MLGEHLSPARFDALLESAQAAPRWLDIDPEAVHTHYNRNGFLVSHRLPEHPLFDLEPLFRLCRRMPPQAVKHRFGIVPGNAHFDTSNVTYNRGLTLDDAIDHLEEKRAYIAIYNPEKDPEYKPVIEGLVGELGLATRSLERGFNWYSTYIFISANDSVTPYHMDREMNFLLQVRGRKTVQLWDPRDSGVMTPAQRDFLFSYGDNSRPTWHDGLPAKAHVFELQPGLGVHHPFIAPHLVTTGPNLSVSLAITFRSPQSDIWTDAHVYNYKLRRLGLGRIPVRENDLVDVAKANFIRAVRKARAAVKGEAPEVADAAH
jgi:hypothetical protein